MNRSEFSNIWVKIADCFCQIWSNLHTRDESEFEC